MMMQSLPLEPRVAALETAQNETTQTLRWVVAQFGRVTAVQDEHTLRFERLEKGLAEVRAEVSEVRADVSEVRADVAGLRAEVAEVRADVAGLRADLPGMMAEVMREVLRDARKS